MKLVAEPDQTQLAILEQLKVTENLLALAAAKVSGRGCSAEILPMPDLGIPHNVLRIRGGFFTGAYYRWDTDVPLVPVDATVNVCGVALFKTSLDLTSRDEFLGRVRAAREVWETRTPFVWNFASGNHFVIYAEVTEPGFLEPGRYLVLHASAAEFKSQYNGLYPQPGNWYHSDIQVLDGPGGRYLRYIAGSQAEQFFSIATMLVKYQQERMRLMAGLILGARTIDREILSVPHYGMPDQSSVAIGCQWMYDSDPLYLFLTRPHEPLYLVRAAGGGPNSINWGDNAHLITPHGLGVAARGALNLIHRDGGIQIAGADYKIGDSLGGAPFASIRKFNKKDSIARLLEACPGSIQNELHQLYSYYHHGES